MDWREAPYVTISVQGADGMINEIPLPVENAEITFEDGEAFVDGPFGRYYLTADSTGWELQKSPWLLRMERESELRKDVLAYLDAQDRAGRDLAARIRKEHW